MRPNLLIVVEAIGRFDGDANRDIRVLVSVRFMRVNTVVRVIKS